MFMLNWIVRNRTVGFSTCVQTNNWCLIELLVSFGVQFSTLPTDFFKISQNALCASSAWRHPHSVTPFPICAIVTSLSDTFAPPVRAREHLCLCCT